MKLKFSSISLLLVSCFLMTNIIAKEIILEPIIVAVKIPEKRLLETTTSLAIIGEEVLYDKAFQSLEDLVGQVPNVNFSSDISRVEYIQIRGIGEISATVNPSVRIMIDGMDFSHFPLALTLFDTKQIEILKGPQGTTSGVSGMAGVINIESNEPSEVFEGHLETTIGNYNTQAYGMALSGTVIDDVLEARLSLYDYSHDSYSQNTNTRNLDELTVKLQLRWFVSDIHTIDLDLRHRDSHNAYDVLSLDNAQKVSAFAIKSNYEINDAMYLITKLTHSNSDIGFTGNTFDAYIKQDIQSDIDIKLLSDIQGRIIDDSTDWTIGLYFKDYSQDILRQYSSIEKSFKSQYKSTNTAIYGQLDTALNNKLTLVSGLRIDAWNAIYEDSDLLESKTDEVLLGGKLGLNYQNTPEILYYTYLSKGYKVGGFNADNSLPSTAKVYDSENLWNIEAGLNSSHFDDTVINRLNIFYGQRIDQQIQSSNIFRLEDGSTDFGNYINNPSKSYYYGLESQLDWYPNERIHLFYSIGLLATNFDTFNYSPHYQYNFGFDMTFWEGWIWKSNIEGRGAYYFSNRSNKKSQAYTLLHSSVEYTIGSWSVVAWMRNIADTDYEIRGFGDNTSKGSEVECYTQRGRPRTAGLTLSYDF